MNVAINAIRLHVVKVLGRQMPILHIRPRRERRLPTVLSMEEVRDILASTNNLKYQTVLSLIYSGGLRVSEAVHLQRRDIDWERKVLVIRQSKGNKDSQAPLAHHLKDQIQRYLDAYRPKTSLKKVPLARNTPPRASRSSSAPPAKRLESRSTLRSTPYGTVSPPTFWKAGRICASSKPSWATPAPKPRRSTPMFRRAPSRTSKPPSTSCTMHSQPKETAMVTDNHPR